MHVINGDSNTAEPTTLLKIASTDPVLRMLEDRFPGHEPRYCVCSGRPARYQPRSDRHRNLRETTDGRHHTALSVQRHYLDAATPVRAAVRRAPPPRSEYALDLWQRTLDAIESGDYSSIDTEIDWAVRRSFWMRILPVPARLVSLPIMRAPASVSWIWRTTTSTRSVVSSTRWFVSGAVKRILPEALLRRMRLSCRTLARSSVRVSLMRRLRRGAVHRGLGAFEAQRLPAAHAGV